MLNGPELRQSDAHLCKQEVQGDRLEHVNVEKRCHKAGCATVSVFYAQWMLLYCGPCLVCCGFAVKLFGRSRCFCF